MLRHADIWQAVDTLAKRHGLSASGLARKAGLDPTAFNKSKRATPDGRLHWPSTETVAKILTATGTSLDDFLAVVAAAAGRRVPVAAWPASRRDDLFDPAGRPLGGNWRKVRIANVRASARFALKVVGDGLEPAYRDGDLLLILPGTRIRPGDRVVAMAADGELMAGRLISRDGGTTVLRAEDGSGRERSFARRDLTWMHRVAWAAR